MDINPFDQFAGEFASALPNPSSSQPPENANALSPPQFNLNPPKQPPQQPVMNNNNGYGQMMNQGAMVPQYGQGMGGGPQQQGMMMPSQSITAAGFNSGGYDGNSSNALVPSSVQSNPYSLGGGPSVNGGVPITMMNQQQPMGMQQPPMGGPAPQLGYGQQPPQHQLGGFNQQQPPQLQNQPSSQQLVNPFGGAPATAQQMNPYQQQQPPPQQIQMDPFSAPPPPQQQLAPPPQQQQMDPWSGGGSVVPMPSGGSVVPHSQPMPPQPAQIASDPWGAPPPAAPASLSSSALVPSNAVNDDPFGIFGSASPPPPPADPFQPPPPTQPYESQFHNNQAPPPPIESDPWAEMGFGSQPSQPPPQQSQTLLDEGDLFDGGIGAATARAQKEASASSRQIQQQQAPPQPSSSGSSKHKKGELPPGGEWYDAKIFTPTLGVMFFKPKELVDSLFMHTDKSTVEALDDRPVVAFIVEGSSARSAGVELGHVLLKVNGIDVKNPKEASRLIKEGPRPLPLLFYVPDTTVTVSEGEHMVKYNTKETSAPNSAKDWKPKYVVVGGIIAQPWMMNMYRSKSEYDIAVIETQARRPISVKVKQFSLQGARIQNDWQGPQMVKYKNKLHPWKYIVILPVSRNPIKIASPNLSQLKPVHEGVRRVLNAQQSRGGGGGGGPHSAQPVRSREEYGGGGSSGGGYNGRGGY
ncbi:hypothetical protein ACHAXN_005312 [Cyclotella atomus]